MNVTRATQSAQRAPERPTTFAGTRGAHSGPQEPSVGDPRPTPSRRGPLGTPQGAPQTPPGTGRHPGAERAPERASWLSVYPSRPGAPLVLPGATLADAIGTTRPDPARIPPHLRALLPLLAAGHPRYRIAYVLGVCRSTLDPRLNRLYRLLGAHNRAQAVAAARAIGLLPDNPKETAP